MTLRTRLRAWWLHRRPVTQTWLAGASIFAGLLALTRFITWIDTQLQPVGAFTALFIAIAVGVVIPLSIGLFVTGMEDLYDEF